MFTNYTEELDASFVIDIQNLNQYQAFDFYNIIEAYGRVMAGYSNNFDAWIYKTDESWCVGFWINGNYLFHSRNLDTYDLKLINERINFSTFKIDGFHFAGNTSLIDSLSELNKSFSLEKFKERYFYVADKINFESKLDVKISLVTEYDTEDVAKLYQQYYIEEYNGVNNKTIEKVLSNINSLMSRELIYKLEIKNEVIGFCSKMSFLSETPNMIGTIFIKEACRNKKYAQYLLSNISKELLNTNQEIYLMTTKDNISSNKMVENIGFIRINEYSDRTIKNYA